MTTEHIHIPVIIETLSPIHIGDGEKYEPLDYLLDQQRKSLCFYDKDLVARSILSQGTEHYSNFCRTCARATNIKELHDFIGPHVATATAREVPLTKRAMEHFSSNPNTLYRAPAASHIRGAFDEIPFIPGSTIKGMLKTAHLASYHPGINRLRQAMADSQRDQITPFGLDDPWRLVHVSDFVPISCQSAIDLPLNVHLKKSPQGLHNVTTLPAPLEVIKSNSRFIGTLRFNTSLYQRTRKKQIPNAETWNQKVAECFPTVPDVQFWQNILDQYGQKLWKKETNQFSVQPGNVPAEYSPLVQRYLQWQSEVGSSQSLMKIGKHAGAISKTLFGGDDQYKGIRKIFIPQIRKELDMQTTIWISSGGLPLGWVKITFPDAQQFAELTQNANEFAQNAHEQITERLQRRKESMQAAALNQQREQERQHQKEADAAAKAQEAQKLASMSEVERVLCEVAQITNLGTRETKLLEYWAKLDTFTVEEQKRYALACKELYVATGRWSGKLKPKQQEKVDKLHKILEA